MRVPDTSIPGLVVNESPAGGRIAYLAADLDRRYMRDLLPDHGSLLANIVRWANREPIPLRVQGAGLIDCHLYRQQDRLIAHLVNLTSTGTWRAPVDELIPVGPIRVAIQIPAGMRLRHAKLSVSGERVAMKINQGWVEFSMSSILDHEMIVLQ